MNETEHSTSPNIAGWVREYGAELYAFAYRQLRSVEDAEDAVQEAFFAAVRNQQNYRGDASPRTWLYMILRSKIVDTVRKHQRMEILSENNDDLDSHLFDEKGHWRTDAAPSPSSMPPNANELDAEDVQKHLNTCLGLLKPSQRLVLLKTYLDDAPAELIRKELNISASNYWVLLHRARHSMRLCIHKHLSLE